MDDPSSMHDPMRRAERYRKVAAEYDDLADGAASPFFRAFFLQIAGQYREHADGGLPVMEEDGAPLASQPRANPKRAVHLRQYERPEQSTWRN
jgi:hypothetical protein